MSSNCFATELYDSLNKLYKTKTYVNGNNIAIEIESDTERYLKEYKFDQLKSINRYFNMSNNLEEAFKDLNDLFKNEYSIEEKENEDCLILTIKIKGDIIFTLDKMEENPDINIKYDNLSDEMKKIIDNNKLILGIDLGTTYSCAAVMIENNVIMIRNSLGQTTTPSFIYFLSKDEVYVGELAKLLPSGEKNIIYNTKRLLGKSLDDEEIEKIKKKLPFNLKKDEKFNLLKIELYLDNVKEEFYPEQLSSLILKKIVEDSEFYLSKKIGKNIKIKDCVITVPAYFNQKQRESTYNSAEILGLNVITMINEPTAASLAYAYKSLENAEKNIVVIDFGGGTLDITLLEYKKDNESIYCKVKFTHGDTSFGGEDFDDKLMEECKKNMEKESAEEFNIFNEIIKNNTQLIRLKKACERAKKRLSSLGQTKIHIGNYTFTIKQEEFIEYCDELFLRLKKVLDDFITKAEIDKNKIDEVILIGGSTLIPKIREIIKEKFDKSQVKFDLDPKEVVAMGAAIRGGKCLNISSVSNIKLFDVTNLPLGVKQLGNIFQIILPRSSKVPSHNTLTFATVDNNQTKALIEVYEGEETENCDKNNLLLGKFEISGFPKRKAGDVKIEIKMYIKSSLLLEITAWQKDNESNNGKLEIKRLNDFSNILNQLEERQNKISFIKNNNYNDIKVSIINYEEELMKQKCKKVKDKNLIKNSFINILVEIGNYLKINDLSNNLYISFIKYYFNKICEFVQECKIDKEELLKSEEKQLKEIKESIPILFEKIQFNYIKDLIFEIIEEIVDEDNVFQISLNFIMQSLWDEIYTIFKLTSLDDKYDEATKNLSLITSLADVCLGFIERFDKEKTKINNITKVHVQNMKFKIKVRETIIKIRKFPDYLDSNSLNELYNKYYNFIFNEPEDLEELRKITNKAFDDKFEKVTKFINWLDTEVKSYDIYSAISEILDQYPYDINDDNKQEKWRDFEGFKYGKISKENYLDKIKGKYYDLVYSEGTLDIYKNIYNAILSYLNKIT